MVGGAANACHVLHFLGSFLGLKDEREASHYIQPNGVVTNANANVAVAVAVAVTVADDVAVGVECSVEGAKMTSSGIDAGAST